MKYTLEHITGIFGSFWVIYKDNNDYVQTPCFSSRDAGEAIKMLRELRGE